MKKIIAVAALALIMAAIIGAVDVGGVSLPDAMNAEGAALTLNGAGVRTKFIFKVYAGGLYLQNRSAEAARIIEADEPMAIRLHFLMNVDRKSITDAWNEGFKNSAGSAYDSLKSRIDQFNGCFSADVKKDGVYDIVYVPGQGIMVSIDGAQKAVIPGLDFKKAAFGIWLGEKPADSGLRKGMLGG